MTRNRPIAMSPSRIIRAAALFDDHAIWRVIEPAFRAGETYPLPRDISRAHAFAYRRASGDFRHLERDVAAVTDDLRADLDELRFQARQRPVFDRFGRRQRAQEVAEIVGQRVKLKSDDVGGERSA